LVSVSGQVTVSGQPLSGAIISWEPIQGTPGPKASAPVFNGAYEIAPSAKLYPGQYRVRICMMPAEMLNLIQSEEPFNLPPAGRAISREFDSDSQLTAELQLGTENRYDWEVKFQPR
jgi:hypothetical protein